MVNLEEQENLFLVIGADLKQKTECFVIGGSAMLYYKAKDRTKDIDLVFTNEKKRDAVKKVLEGINFKVRDARILYFEKKNLPILMNRGEERFDLFYKKIISFELTETIMDRAKKTYEYNNLIARIISPEDIILLKCATERAGDRGDAKQLIDNYNIKWDAIIEEAQHQSEIGGDLFVIYLFDFFEELVEDLKVNIPNETIKRLMKLGEDAMIKLLKEKKINKKGIKKDIKKKKKI